MNKTSVFQEMKVNDHVNMTLDNGYTIDGEIYMLKENGFMIYDNISGDIFFVSLEEVEKVNEYIG